MWKMPGSEADTVTAGISTGWCFGGVQYTYYLQEQLVVTAGIQTVTAGAGADVRPDSIFAGTSSIVSAPIGVR
jgi:hypothetical protein